MAVTPWHFVGLKMRVMRNGLRGQRWRIALFVIGLVFGAWFSVVGFVLFSATGFAPTAPAWCWSAAWAAPRWCSAGC